MQVSAQMGWYAGQMALIESSQMPCTDTVENSGGMSGRFQSARVVA